MKAQPPGPGLPRHAPSVVSVTCFMAQNLLPADPASHQEIKSMARTWPSSTLPVVAPRATGHRSSQSFISELLCKRSALPRALSRGFAPRSLHACRDFCSRLARICHQPRSKIATSSLPVFAPCMEFCAHQKQVYR
jgi:hypothetical protein